MHRILWRKYPHGPEFPVPCPEISGASSDISGPYFPVNEQISGGAINTPPPTSGQTSSLTLKSTIRASSDLADLPIQPLISADPWRIEEGGPDLHLYQADFHFPLILLRAPLLGFPLGKPSTLCTHLCVFVTDPCCLRAPNSLWVVPQTVVVKAPAFALKDPIVEGEPYLCGLVHRRRR